MIGFTAAVLVALAAGVFLGLSLRHDTKSTRTSARTTKSAFVVSSQWVHRTKSGKIDMRVLSGTVRGAPRWPVVIWDDGGSEEPQTFSFDDSNGALRIIEASHDDSSSDVLLRDRRGDTFLLDGVQVTEMGRPLDPRHLPALTTEGVAAEIHYGVRGKQSAVVLIGATRTYGKVYGYLTGFSVAGPSHQASDRPLLGPDHAYYRIDRRARRLKKVAWSAMKQPQFPGLKCSNWPEGKAGTYRACPYSIELLRPDGSRVSLLHKANLRQWGSHLQFWSTVLPSPDGKQLLLGSADNTCFQQASFLPARGGVPTPTIAEQSFFDSFPIGWLEKDVALVAAFGRGECLDSPPGGIYMVAPDWGGNFQEVARIRPSDATIWRSN